MAMAQAPQSVFAPAGPVAQTQLNLLNLTLWIAIGIFVVVGSILLYTVIRFRAKPGDPIPNRSTGAPSWKWSGPSSHCSSSPSSRCRRCGTRLISPRLPPTTSWKYESSVTSGGGRLSIPISASSPRTNCASRSGKAVHLTMESKDVIHSFWVPRLAGKMDVIPNRLNSMWFTADEAGIYYGQCAEFCGTSHANMRFRVIALPAEEFDQWVQGRHAVDVFTPMDDMVARGQEIFESTGTCFACHNVDGTAAIGTVGPDLTDFGSRTTLAAGMLANTPENLAAWLRDPQGVKPGALMPKLPLSDGDIEALTAFLYSLE